MFSISTMPSLTPCDWAYHQPPISSPLRPSRPTEQDAFFKSSPPGSPTRSSPIRPSMTKPEELSLGTARQSLFSAFNYEDNNSIKSSNRKFPASSPIRGADRFSRFSDRQIRPNPVMRKREDEQTTRRRLFLRTVRDRADDQRFEKRSIEAQAIRSWHEEHQQYLAYKAREASGNDLEMDSYIDEAINAQQQEQPDYEDLPETYMDEYPADLEYEAMMKDDGNAGLMSEWDLDDDMLLDLIRAEEQKQGDTDMS